MFMRAGEGKSVPKFKFKQNGGRSELCRDFAGPNVKNYYAGLASFMKSGISLDGSFQVLSDEVPQGFDIYIYLKEGDAVKFVEPGQVIRCGDLKAVAVVPKDSEALKGVQSTLLGNFCDTANKVGSALTF